MCRRCAKRSRWKARRVGAGPGRVFAGRVLAAAVSGVLVACGPAVDPDGGGEASLPTWTVDTAFALDLEGGEAGFGRIAGVAVLGNGAIAVGDAHHRHVLIYPSGDQAPPGAAPPPTPVGRRGEGPGEFESIDALWPVGRDSVAVWDGRLLRYTVVAVDGGVGRSVTLRPTGERSRPTPLGFGPGGRLVAVNDPRGLLEDESYRPTLELLTFDADGRPSSPTATFPGPEMWNWVWEMGVTPSLVPFGRPTVFTLRGSDVLVGTNDEYSIERFSLDGITSRHVELERSPRELTGERIEAYRAAERERALSGSSPKGNDDVFAVMADEAPYPETLPHYDRLLVDGAGNLWVRDYVVDEDAPSTWIVFDRDGAPRARAELPAGFTPAVLDSGRVIGVWRDVFDVETVRVYRLETSAT
ncbi:MAG: hypothetical protein R3195_03140 [Gemmatimonadota bacterium]|nr:hypothetical protein [Gemmatimonadota bacterium]